MHIKTFIKQLLAIILLFSTGCIKEDRSDCYAGLRLTFSFTLHTDDGDRFGPDIQNIRVYFFDEARVLRHIEQAQGAVLSNGYKMQVALDPGQYTVVAWGGSNEDFYNSYHVGHMSNAVNSQYIPEVTIGETTLDDFRVFLNYNIADDFPEDIVPVIDEFDDLYYGAVGVRQPGSSNYLFEKVQVEIGAWTERHIEMIRNTNILKVTVSGLQYLMGNTSKWTARDSSGLLEVWVSGRNGRYCYDNTIGEYARMLRYNPHTEMVGEDQMVTDIKVLRLDMNRHSAQPMYLTIRDPQTGAIFPQEPIDIVNTLLQARDPKTGEYIYKNQEDFDKLYEHPIEIGVSADLKITIYVHDWEVIVLRPVQ